MGFSPKDHPLSRLDFSSNTTRKKRHLGIGGKVIVKLDSVALSNGENVGLVGHREFKGNSHTIRMGIAMAIAGAIYLPAAAVF
jgi:hypothetical protein